MGGGGGGAHGKGEYPGYPTNVWSLTGGHYAKPKYWRRNTAICMVSIFLICIPIFKFSAANEVRLHNPARPIPSQLWCKNFPPQEPETSEKTLE